LKALLLISVLVQLPSVIFSVKQEVRAYDGDTHSDNGQDHKHQQHEAVHVVDFVSPERGEDEVPVDEQNFMFIKRGDLNSRLQKCSPFGKPEFYFYSTVNIRNLD
jgi:hypothetical protein